MRDCESRLRNVRGRLFQRRAVVVVSDTESEPDGAPLSQIESGGVDLIQADLISEGACPSTVKPTSQKP